tara:strand:+ start:626 stop:811 length:186 start_codon:yes stop_codon:yes gene_type:complete
MTENTEKKMGNEPDLEEEDEEIKEMDLEDLKERQGGRGLGGARTRRAKAVIRNCGDNYDTT